MIARFDHRPMLTALLALTSILLVVVVVTLTTLLLTAAPSAATSLSESGGANPGAAAAVPGTHGNYGEGWNNYGHDIDQPKPAQKATEEGNVNDPIDRHAEVVARYHQGSLR
jgi:hypothetical protein